MSKPYRIKVHYDKKTKNYFLKLKDLSKFVDISSVSFYEMTGNSDGTATISFYDKNKKLLKTI